jgi:tetrahydromethanopterin S-methyltransferase subunit G
MDARTPVYVKIQDFEEVVQILDNIKRKVKEARDVLQKLNELKAEEDRELLAWNENLDDISARVAQIDHNLVNQ